MVSTDPTVVIILFELVVFETVTLIGAISYLITKKRRRAKTLASIIGTLKQVKPEREKKLNNTFQAIPYLTEKQSGIAAGTVADSELVLHTFIITAFHDNNTSALENLVNAFEKLTISYETLLPDKDTGDAPQTTREEDTSLTPNVDTAIDELLSNDDPSTITDPGFDLSENAEFGVQNKTLDATGSKIAEISDELLVGEPVAEQPRMDNADEETVISIDEAIPAADDIAIEIDSIKVK
jgi:hypothetical protein